MRTLFIALVLAGITTGALAQERVKPKGPADFNTVHANVKKLFEAGSFGKAYAGSKELMVLIGARRAEAIREALPTAPPEHEKVPFKEPKNQVQQNAMMAIVAGMAASVGNVIKQIYTGPNGQIEVSVTTDSPFIQMFQMLLNNPAMVGENQELIKYGELMAILETQGQRKTLKIQIKSSMVETVFPDHSDDFIFAMWDQAAVSKVEAIISN